MMIFNNKLVNFIGGPLKFLQYYFATFKIWWLKIERFLLLFKNNELINNNFLPWWM